MPITSGKRLLEALNVLVVEDDVLQAEEICLCVTDAGAIILGPASTIKAAVAIIDMNGVDVATVDINLGDGPTFEVAGHLLRLKVPFLFVTGYDCSSMPEEFQHIVCLDKPFSEAALIRCVAVAGSRPTE
jgi:two-component SAPR family response regulator